MSGQDLKKSGITTKMISPGRTYKVWASILIVGLALICLIGFLIGAFYQSQVKLQKSNLERFRYDLERVAAAINYFWSERINDLKQLATSRELYIFFSNKALGMSMEYGLKASLIQIGQLFDRMIHAKRLDDSQIYLRILFQDRAARPLVVKGKRYQDLGAKGSWSGVFSSSTLTPQIVISKENEEWQVLIGVPCLFKGQYEGHVLAWVDGQRVFHKLVTKKLSKEGTFFLSAKLNGKAIPIEATGVAVSQLASKLTSLQPGKVFYFDFPGFRNQKKVTEMLALGVPVAGSPFTFYALVPKADVLGAQPPWHLVTGLIITSSLLVVGLGILLWFNHQTTLLQARLSEEAIRSKELQAEIAIRKQTERALRASEERYRHIVDNATEIIYETDVEGRFTFFNPMATQLTCYTAKELRTKRFLDLVRPDLAQEVEQFYRRQYIERILKTYYEFPILTKFGEELWLGQNVRLVTEADKIIGFRAVARDITESKHSRDTLQQSHDDLEERVRRRTAELEAANKVLSREIEERKRVEAALRESEERYHRILEASPDPIVLYDMEGKVIYVNPAFSRIFGWTLEEVIGKKLDFVPEEAWPETLKRLEQLKRGESFFGFETSRYTKKGEIVEVNISAAVWRGKDGTLSGSIVNLRDITEQKKMEAQLRHAQKMEAVGTLAGGIAHDFNNVLQAVSGYVQLLMMKKSPGDPELKYLAGIDQSVQRAEGLIRQLLTVSRRLESYLEPVDLNHEIIQVTQLLERTIPKMIDIELHLAGDLCMVNADPTQLEQIILNLANNAKDAMPDGGQLTFETQNIVVDETYSQTHPGLEPGQYVLLKVSDTGCGMDKETMEHIFEPFFTTKGWGAGTGLGLATVYRIIKNHHGHIICSSESGRGTTFTIYLPARHPTAMTLELPRNEDGILNGKETILLVDDEDTLLDTGEEMLRQYGYSVLRAASGEEALEIFETEMNRIDLVVLDLNMPGMGGYRCLQKLKLFDPKIKVIIVSGYSADSLPSGTIESEADGFVGKPYRLRDLLKKIRNILDS